MNSCLVGVVDGRIVASLFRGGEGSYDLHTLAIIMENSHLIDGLEEYPRDLFVAVVAAYPAWLGAQLRAISKGAIADHDLAEIVAESERQMSADLLALLQTDVDEQRSNPLHVLRLSTVLANERLQHVNVVAPQRDEFEVAAMPHDVYAIGPLTWKDLGDDVHDAGITWGAWKAATVLTRRRAEGKIS